MKNYSIEDISRIIEMAWEDRTPFEAIETQFGMNYLAASRRGIKMEYIFYSPQAAGNLTHRD